MWSGSSIQRGRWQGILYRVVGPTRSSRSKPSNRPVPAQTPVEGRSCPVLLPYYGYIHGLWRRALVLVVQLQWTFQGGYLERARTSLVFTPFFWWFILYATRDLSCELLICGHTPRPKTLSAMISYVCELSNLSGDVLIDTGSSGNPSSFGNETCPAVWTAENV